MKKTLAALTAAVLMVSLSFSVAVAAPKATSLWSVYNINAGGMAYTPKAAPGTTDSAANFSFPSKPTTALLTTSKDKALLGDLTGSTLTATFAITESPTAFANFTYSGAPGECGLHGPYVRLYFAGTIAGPFNVGDYWWSNQTFANLADVLGNTELGNPTTLSVSLDPTLWSNWGGKFGNEAITDFNAAVANVTQIGLSFGGGCFFANGVGLSAGSASFILTNYTVSP